MVSSTIPVQAAPVFTDVFSLSVYLVLKHVIWFFTSLCVLEFTFSNYYIVLQIANYQREVDPCIEELSNIKVEDEVLQWCSEYFTSLCNKKQKPQPGKRKRRDK